ncbi:hypothetical protein Kpol_312p8 [Vanderwaltozyma polyspora DSM 70294]|uniref:Mannose-6-phosphate isomerase n=1 Tax=Vanderwaltozyma polyspora (strain ATCC 22028 / DSM 70294 / BCRC 21397 / CBS 2163 / NBRC 10782 / NRRL Y-8283 / UCD 57-17) TaxID=436907 RepID=A7TSJ1_VANPO|nr:uncharacterized protein Kpol_312p8 [Vanderwaltozyma polyspora DSM 70294]EDO14769.1 hypothetical protein Kpol_312p8 [Vanderwaltozyma polyspora DSM 70294]
MSDKVFQLIAGYQQYDWGKIGSTSAVAQFSAHSDPTVKINENEPYAELWMGTHPKVPSKSKTNQKTLNELISEKPETMLGNGIISQYKSTSEIPFLFKVLSIKKVLSIQAHPDKSLAKILRAQDPANYPDDNHKPEMAIAVTDFEGFCGFKPLEELAEELKTLPEFLAIVGKETADNFINNIKPNVENGSQEDIENRKLLQSIFSKVMNATDAEIETQAKLLIERAQNHPADFARKELPELLIRLNEQFPNDVGLFCGGLMLNHCTLQSGEAIFLKAKDPHAYISGDIIECMAASDNVVRAGFTPKFKDVKNLVSMLTYSYDPVEDQKMKPEEFARSSGSGKSTLYNPPIDEFAVLETTFTNSVGTRHFEGVDGPSIIITTKGNGFIVGDNVRIKAEPGFVFFVAPNTSIDLETDDSSFTTYRAFSEPTI